VPVRSFSSAVLKWPDRESVLASARAWARELRDRDPAVRAVWCVGSYARNDWGVGSDIDIIIILTDSPLTREQRYIKYHSTVFPVPCDLWVHTQAEWDRMAEHSPMLRARLDREKLDLLVD
jgi:predicted nucleotidyltransferase